MRNLALAALLAATAGCSGLGTSNYRSTYAAADADPKLAEAMNGFALEFYAALKEHPGKEVPEPNLMVSPAGLAMVLSMLRGGAEGETAAEMDNVLRLNGISGEALDRGQMVFRDLLRGSDPSIRMEIANSLWMRKGFHLNTKYAQRMEDSYGAQIQALEFSSDEAAETINDWASEHTDGRITKVADSLVDSMVLVLLNAMYFKGTWTEPFDESLTQDRPFVTSGGEEIQVPTMRQGGSYAYLDGEGFKAVRLPYGEAENFGMVLALPDKDSSLEQFWAKSLPEFDKWSADLADLPGTVELPRFKLADKLKLNEALIAMGMPLSFDKTEAEFGGLSAVETEPGALYVSAVSHYTYIDVNEEGTEAAAVTSVGLAGSSEPVSEPFELKLNRPFFFAITDRTTGLIVFMGEVGNPAES